MKNITSLAFRVGLVYRNMWVGRNKLALFALILAGFVSTLQCYSEAIRLGPVFGYLAIMIGVISWGVVLPIAVCFIDCQRNPKRITRLTAGIPN